MKRMFRTTLLGRGVRRAARLVARPILDLRDYLLAEVAYAPGGWRQSSGWSEEGLADAQEKHWPILMRNLQGAGPLGVAHFPWHTSRKDRADHNVMMSYGYVLALAAGGERRLSILDWGGGVGQYLPYSRALLPGVEFDYHCYDVPGLCRLGRRLQPGVHFSDEPAELLGRRYQLVISSSSLHYFEHWQREAGLLAAATSDYLYIARLQVAENSPTFAVVHRVQHDGYGEFPSWCINRGELIDCIEQCGLRLMREFLYYSPVTVRGISEQMDCRGFLFRRSIADEA
jgi:putative methyltransferase (TIGR04325 family)